MVCEYLFEALRLAGVERAYVVLRAGKWDIPARLGDGSALGVDLAYLAIERSDSVPETLDHAYPFVREARVALGFPDVLALPASALAEVAARQLETAADVVLGLFPTDRPDKADMVECDAGGRLLRIEVKPERTALRQTWLYAVWGPAFTAFLRGFLRRRPDRPRPASPEGGRELALSDVLLAAVAGGLRVECVAFPRGSHLDVGTPEDLARAGDLLRRETAVD